MRMYREVNVAIDFAESFSNLAAKDYRILRACKKQVSQHLTPVKNRTSKSPKGDFIYNGIAYDSKRAIAATQGLLNQTLSRSKRLCSEMFPDKKTSCLLNDAGRKLPRKLRKTLGDLKKHPKIARLKS